MGLKPVLKSLSFFELVLIVSTVQFSGCSENTPQNINDPVEEYECGWNGIDDIEFLDSLSCPDELELLAGSPLVPVASEVKSIKTVYEISSRKMYYISSKHFQLHYDFCKEVSGYQGSHSDFNSEQYSSGTQRLYYLASVNYYKSSGTYTMEFYVGDQISSEGVSTVYDKIVKTAYFGKKLCFFPNSSNFKEIAAKLPGIPTVSEKELYGSQRYQPCNTGEAYGYLRKIDISEIGSTYIGRHDVVLVNGLPVDIPVIAGIITTVFQTPLSHINVLSHNRGTPNMALKTAWDDPEISNCLDKLVHLTVTNDTFSIKNASITEAQAFWEKREPKQTITLECNDTVSGLFDVKELSIQSTPLVGAKAANLAEIAKITLDGDSMPIPEGAFAIPFYYYRQHINQNGIDKFIEGMLDDSLFSQNFLRRKKLLEDLRDTIINAPLDSRFVQLVEEKIRSVSDFNSIRFRSSTNAEDIEGFNGAGLYESFSAYRGDTKKTVSAAIKKVFAGLWTLRGFEERDYFKIDHGCVAMGVLVHRAFPAEEVNGVAITQNIYNPFLGAYTINAQIKDISVVNPPAGFTADQLLFHTGVTDPFTDPVIEYITHSNVNEGEPVMSDDELVSLARWLNVIHNYYYFRYYRDKVLSVYQFAMDVEFKLDHSGRKLYIKQARPY